MVKRKRTAKNLAEAGTTEIPDLATSDSGTYTLPLAAPPPTKRSKKVAKNVGNDEAAPAVQEARLARIRNSCPKNITERVDRVMTQRFFMIDRRRNGEELREEFKVLGSTGNVYKVVIDKLPSCDCPDAAKGNHCKHILFIFLKVLGVSQFSNLYYQKALLTTELASIFSTAPKNPSSVASNRIRELYAAAIGEPSSSKGKEADVTEGKKRKKFEDGDDCPICYEALMEAKESDLVFCETCNNALHEECFSQWRRTNAGKTITCVWCRSPWVDLPGPGEAGPSIASISRDGYLNLGTAAGLSPVRDTSTYYQGPRKGQSYWHSSRKYW
ncbi:hypothetical protein FRC03_003843 [Tulasnella sp. 419]|nr:hypothetical protein FRC03_003843 [Tulasnella sp. 419]